MIYQYLTGPRFRHRVEAIIEAFWTIQEDLDKEKKVITKQWAKREEQVDRVMQAAAGMYGDPQGIAGKRFKSLRDSVFQLSIMAQKSNPLSVYKKETLCI